MNRPGSLSRQKIAVIGAGIAGLGCAYLLNRHHHVALYERETRLGGHSNTLCIDYAGTEVAVDTGFIVYNEPNYPNLVGLLGELGVPTDASDMSFSVSIGDGALEWSGSTIGTLFAQKANLLKPGFHRMWLDILRFNKAAPRDWAAGKLSSQTLGEYLEAGRYSARFSLDYLLPMGAAIWSSPMDEMLAFPASSFVRFCMNHGLLTVNDRPQWRTVRGGSREYVARIADTLSDMRHGEPVVAVQRVAGGVKVRDAAGHVDTFDHLVMASHGDQTLRMLGQDIDAEERAVLSAFRYQPNRAVLHRDANLMPKRRAVWASWNYMGEARRDLKRRVGLTYWMNRLQNLDDARPLFVSLNPLQEPAPGAVFAEIGYEHPLFDEAALDAQRRLPAIQGRGNIWYCGSYCGYGFHEDGLASGVAVAEALGAPRTWAANGNPDIHPMPALKPAVLA